jgi:hypothetical protein
MSGVLLGRRHESHVLDQLLETARGGQSQVLVLEGEAGIGKTALLENVATAAAGFTVVRASGVESEMQLAFAALHQLCGPMLDRVAHLPPPQRDALEVAFGLTAGPSADRFVVGLAVLSLLSEAATERPLLCLVDDAQWLDETSLQALAFVARRLLAESIAIVFGTRTPGDALKGLPRLSMVGLDSDNARALLESALQAPLDPVVGDRIIAESAGNPLALLELPRATRATDSHATPPGGGSSGTYRRPATHMARRRDPGHRDRRGSGGGIGRPPEDRHSGDLPPPTRPISDLPGRQHRRAPESARRFGGRHRPSSGSGSASVAPRLGFTRAR